MKKIIFFTFIYFLYWYVYPQDRVIGNLIIWHHKNIRGNMRADFMSRYAENNLTTASILSPELNIVLYTFDPNSIDEYEMLKTIRDDNTVYLAQFDPILSWRDENRNEAFIPNDPAFNQQWHLRNTGQSGGIVGADISAIYAWGEVLAIEDRNDREIVVAVPDSGLNIHHPDINWWRNESGYCPIVDSEDVVHGFNCPNVPVCDYWGWDTMNGGLSENPLLLTGHGLHVSGIVAATTHNDDAVASIGGLGIKIMPIRLVGGANSAAISAYNYILQKRILYNETNGDLGDFIVATNASWGINFAWPHQYPVWAEMYDLMGQQGILSTGAVPNANRNIDIEGDMPGTVTSQWFLSVTNTNRFDFKTTNAGYGPIHVHLGAPGTNIITTQSTNSFGDAGSGTSYATPQVTGTIALMYLAASENLLKHFDNNPAELASIFRNFILSGVDPISNLSGITVTGGRLNSLNPILSVKALNEEYVIEPIEIYPFLIFDFDTNTKEPALGVGTIIYVGGTGPATYGEFAPGWIDVDNSALNTSSYPAQETNPETAGIAINASTSGFLDIHLSWNNLNSDDAANRLRLQYTLDGNIWINFQADETNAKNFRFNENNVNNPEIIGFDNGLYITEGNNWYERYADFSNISEINNNSDFAVRFVTAFPTYSYQYEPAGMDFYNPAGSIRFDNITFYYTETSDMEIVQTPYASHSGDIYLSPIPVILWTETIGASIYFTTDGSNPNASNGFLYSSPIAINSTTNLRFRAVLEGMISSEIVTEIYTLPIQISNILELRHLEPDLDDFYHLFNEVYVVMTQQNFRNQIYIQDETAGILIDDQVIIIDPIYSIGDAVKGLAGHLKIFNDVLTFEPFINSGVIISTENEISPIMTTFSDLSEEADTYQSRLVKILDVLFTADADFEIFTDYSVIDDTGEFTFRPIFAESEYIGSPIPQVPVNITGIVTTQNNISFISARFMDDFEIVEIEIATPEIFPPSGFYEEPITVSINCETENVWIYYTLDGSEPSQDSILYTDPFELAETAIVNAIAFDIYGYFSFINTADYAIYKIAPPKNLQATVEETTVTLTWEAPFTETRNHNIKKRNDFQNRLTSVLGYNVYRDEQLLTETATEELVYIDEVINKDMLYVYEVTTLYHDGESESVVLQVVVPLLNPPNNLQYHLAGALSGELILIWEKPQNQQFAELLGYNVYLNNEKINIEIILNAFYIEKVSEGSYLVGVTAVYDLGESEPETIEAYVSDFDNNSEIYVTALGGNYPNPFNPETTIYFSLEKSTDVIINIFNIRGQRIRSLLNDFKERGIHNIIWNGTDDFGKSVGNGVYFFQMSTDDYSEIKRMLLLK
ncbi:MAG: chitobiase/beta-hexosaminidase C-terminal domain-containing protein [Candidatus Cloacimonetes bacterium]|nr:chitobiase/beta-hexosaminidase C-terminal domain-containing protein [Candidatus Cloacimonadota bacterium]